MTIIYTHNPGESAQAVNDENPLPVSMIRTKVPGIQSSEVTAGTTDVQGVLPMASLRLMGTSVRENAATAAAATVLLRHGSTANEPVLAIYELDGDQSARDWFGPDGLACPGGVYVDRVSGTTHLVLYWKAGE